MFQTLSINERDFLKEAIKTDFRVDARGRLAFRHLDLRFGTSNGQALLKLGRTQISTQSSLKLIQPQGSKPNEGTFKFNVEFSSLVHGCENAGMNVTLQEMKIEIAQFIDKVLKSSRAIDRESLCIVQSRLVWNLQVDLFVVNEDGNMFDACFLAAVACLMNTRLPEVTLAGL
jgi:exosome complex component RRP45